MLKFWMRGVSWSSLHGLGSPIGTTTYTSWRRCSKRSLNFALAMYTGGPRQHAESSALSTSVPIWSDTKKGRELLANDWARTTTHMSALIARLVWDGSGMASNTMTRLDDGWAGGSVSILGIGVSEQEGINIMQVRPHTTRPVLRTMFVGGNARLRLSPTLVGDRSFRQSQAPALASCYRR
jgi:hypothetical protein